MSFVAAGRHCRIACAITRSLYLLPFSRASFESVSRRLLKSSRRQDWRKEASPSLVLYVSTQSTLCTPLCKVQVATGLVWQSPWPVICHSLPYRCLNCVQSKGIVLSVDDAVKAHCLYRLAVSQAQNVSTFSLLLSVLSENATAAADCTVSLPVLLVPGLPSRTLNGDFFEFYCHMF